MHGTAARENDALLRRAMLHQGRLLTKSASFGKPTRKVMQAVSEESSISESFKCYDQDIDAINSPSEEQEQTETLESEEDTVYDTQAPETMRNRPGWQSQRRNSPKMLRQSYSMQMIVS